MSDKEESAEQIQELEEGEEDFKDENIIPVDGPASPELPSSNGAEDGEIAGSDEVSDTVQSAVEGYPADVMTKAEGKGFEVELDFESDCTTEKNVNEIEEGEEKEEQSDEEDGEIPGEKPEKKKSDKELEEGEDDGEISDDDEELEEGELKEKSDNVGPVSKQPTRQVCRFFNRGKCTFGTVCRFLHLNNNERGNYNMFQSNTDRYNPAGGVWPGNMNTPMMNPRSRMAQDFFIPPPIIPVMEPSPVETAWERGLRTAKELVKKAHIRKGTSPDFEEKRLNLSLSEVPEKENDKENELNKSQKKKRERQNDFYKYEEDEYAFGEPQAQWKRPYENFEIRYTRDEQPPYREREKGPRGMRRQGSPSDRDKMPKGDGRRWENNRIGDIVSRKRAEEWFDPYRRSKSPKGRRSRSRTRSGSYSTVSSYSYSNRSSASYSRSSSGSSGESSRSPSPLSKRKSPNESVLSPKGQNRFLPKKRSGGRSSSSRSLSMDSITSSSSGHSSSGSLTHRSKTHASILSKKDDDRPQPDLRGPSSTKIFQELQKLKDKKDSKIDPDDIMADFLPSQEEEAHVPTFPSLQHLLPSIDKNKEPAKGLQKQQIKLTLLNKSQPNKFASLQKELDTGKSKQIEDEPPKFNAFHPGVKRPLSPPSPVSKPAPALLPKKSASSRRDELLKQLKAVEDAIARKRAKFC